MARFDFKLAPPVPAALQAEYARSGLTSDATLNALLARNNRQWPQLEAVVDEQRRFTHSELLRIVSRAAGTLKAAGVGPGDVVAWQLPNSWEAFVTVLATWHVGAVTLPIVTLYREHELRHIFSQARPSVVLAPASYRNYEHAGAIDSLLVELDLDPLLKVTTLGSHPGWTTYDDFVSGQEVLAPEPVGPDDPCLILYTSGTSAAPKGGVHTSRTLLAETRQMAHAWSWGWEDVSYMPVPLSHITGILLGITVPLYSGGKAVLAAGWDAEQGVRDMREERVTMGAGAALFVQELLDAYDSAGIHETTLRAYACGGSAIPSAIMERSEELGFGMFRIYGMTELPTVTMGNRSYPYDRRAYTDGPIAIGVECEAVDDARTPVGDGTEGELRVRGPERMLGYLDAAATAAAIDDDGWFYTGDLGVVSEGFVTVTGRIKDIINRGGEKFSARDIEDALIAHPRVFEAAVVAAPHARFGEVPAAFVIPRSPDSPPTGEELAEFLAQSGLAKQKTPVSWRMVSELPRTGAGKVKKFELVEQLDD